MRLHPEVATTDTDDGTVLLHQRTGRYWQLNTTGAQVLSLLREGCEPDQIAVTLAERLCVEPQRVERDVAVVIEQLRAAQLVVD